MKNDPLRIHPLMKRLTVAWSQNPELRLGQLIGNALNNNVDLYYVEDDKLIAELELYNAGFYGERSTSTGTKRMP
jgi:hypothetical protein